MCITWNILVEKLLYLFIIDDLLGPTFIRDVCKWKIIRMIAWSKYNIAMENSSNEAIVIVFPLILALLVSLLSSHKQSPRSSL